MVIRHTRRLRLRPLSLADLDIATEIHRDPAVQEYLHARPDAATVESWLAREISDFRKCGRGLLALELRESGSVVGYAGVIACQVGSGEHPQLLVVVHPQWRHMGIAGEAAQAVLDWAQTDLDLDTVLAVVNPRNEASIALVTRLGACRRNSRPLAWPGEMPEMVYSFDRVAPAGE